MTSLAAAVPKEQKKYFEAGFKSFSQPIGMPKGSEPAAGSKTPVKSPSHPASIEDIKLDDAWDLEGASKE